MTTTLSVEAMTCEHCEQTVEESLESVDGVTEATADRKAGTVTVDGGAETGTLVDAVADAGYEASA